MHPAHYSRDSAARSVPLNDKGACSVPFARESCQRTGASATSVISRSSNIKDALSITRGTVKWHVNIILRRLGVSDRTQAVVIATRRGIVEI